LLNIDQLSRADNLSEALDDPHGGLSRLTFHAI